MRVWFTAALLAAVPLALAAQAGEARIEPVAALESSPPQSESIKTFESGPARVELLELYTSEGCHSCPPADRWFSKLKSDEGLWREFVPVTFHVDYWDYIGWKDRFAQARFTERQRRYAAEGGTRVIYTPGVFLNGVAWEQWRRGGFQPREGARAASPTNDPAARNEAHPGKLAIAVDGRDVAAHFDPARQHRGELVLNAAIVSMNLVSSVDAGENAGKILRHDFVVLDLESAPLSKTAAGYRGVVRFDAHDDNPFGTAVVAWVSSEDRQTPIQAVGGYLTPPP